MRVRTVAIFIAVVLLTAGAALLWPRGDQNVQASPTTTTTTTAPTPTMAPPPEHAFEAADAIVPEVHVYESPTATEPYDALANPTVEDVPLAFLVKQHGPPGWLLVQLQRRPNESTAWIHADEVSLRPLDNRIVVQLSTHLLTVYKGLTDQVLFQAPVAVGAPRTPTPLGHFFIDVVVKLAHPSGAYGPYQLSVAGFSNVLQSFGGGPGQIAIHGTNHPELIGGDVSNGCIRMRNEDITALQPMAPVGTPVEVVA